MVREHKCALDYRASAQTHTHTHEALGIFPSIIRVIKIIDSAVHTQQCRSPHTV